MGRMIRKQVYIEPEQDALLKQQAAVLGVTESELIRRGISFMAYDLRPTTPARRDEQAWRVILEYLEERARTLPVTGGEPHWSREETYDWRWERGRNRLSG